MEWERGLPGFCILQVFGVLTYLYSEVEDLSGEPGGEGGDDSQPGPVACDQLSQLGEMNQEQETREEGPRAVSLEEAFPRLHLPPATQGNNNIYIVWFDNEYCGPNA